MPFNSKPSPSKVLVPVGPRHIVPKSTKSLGKRQPEEKPTTSRALVLRNGKYGTRGTGEVMLMSKMSGREKMDLLAGKSSTSPRVPSKRPNITLQRILSNNPNKPWWILFVSSNAWRSLNRSVVVRGVTMILGCLANYLNSQFTSMISSIYRIRSCSDTSSQMNWRLEMNREGVTSAKILPT